jgi:sugar phosphate isomerase/epimerase
MKLAVNLWTVYGWNLPEPVSADVLRALARMGSQGVELVIDDGANSAETLLNRRQELSARLAEFHLETPSIGTALFWRYNLASQDESMRRKGLDLVRDGCRVAQAYGAPVLLILAGQQEPQTEYRRSYTTSVETMRQAARIAADAGVTLGVENVGTSLLGSPGEYAGYLADVDHPSVQAYLDFGNGMSVGPSFAENWVTAVAGRIAAVHAKDYDGAVKSHVCCGLGDVDWERTFAALRAAGYDGFLTVETPPRGHGSRPPATRAAGLHAAQTSLQWLSGMEDR